MRLRKRLLAIALAVSLGPAAPALAANPTQNAYGPNTCTDCLNIVTHRHKLPFTGLDVVPLAALGAGLLGAGLATRRRLGRSAA